MYTKIETFKEAIQLLNTAQIAVIKMAKWPEFRFPITENPETKLIEINSQHGFPMFGEKMPGRICRDRLIFSGKSIEEAMESFIKFFVEGKVAYIQGENEDDPYEAELSFENEHWVVSPEHLVCLG